MNARWFQRLIPIFLVAFGVGAALLRSGEEPRAEPIAPAETEEASFPPAPVEIPARIAEKADEAEPPAEAEREPWRILILGPGDEPLAGARVHRDGNETEFVETGDDGFVRLSWGSEEETLEVRLSGTAPEGTQKLTERDSVLRFPDLLPLAVRVLDGATGVRLYGAEVAIDLVHGASLALPENRLDVAPIRRGRQETIRFEVTPPEGYAADPIGGTMVTGTVSRYATEILATVVLWPETPVTIEVRDHEGNAAVGAGVAVAKLSGTHLPVQSDPSGASGEIRLAGVPGLRGEKLTGTVVSEDGNAAVDFTVTIERPGEEAGATVTLPPPDPNRLISGGISGCRFMGSRSCRRRLGDQPTGSSMLVVRVVRRDGRPARDTWVAVAGMTKEETPREWRRTGRTDEAGRLEFLRVPHGPATVNVHEVGFLSPGGIAANIRAIGATEVVVREALGRPLFVEVVDAKDGAPVPHAQIDAGRSFAYLVDDVQRLGIFTDRDGRSVLPDLADGEIPVTATFGSRSVSGKARGGGTLVLRLPR